eukprot:TRINITY_DN13871_c0_g1_i1.p1 TRINITY_DN13871_c0_g1~~TRINITY_DN13871_c0_g1_i1.p1  ORF type:complete len:546 (-),score=90.17 TRINITY_DN13871_c0_g1_i1:135-1655(-)
MSVVSSFLSRVPGIGNVLGPAGKFCGRKVTFPGKTRASEPVEVQEEEWLGAGRTRVRCLSDGLLYDVRRLVPCGSSEASGFTALSSLQALEKEIEYLRLAVDHPNICACYAVISENLARQHSKLLLCDPCCVSLERHQVECNGKVRFDTIADVGRDVSLGTAFFHSRAIICGRLTASDILRGMDGLWKIAALPCAAALPTTSSAWAAENAAQLTDVILPPEARSGDDTELTVDVDTWLLGRLLAALLVAACDGSALLEHRRGRGETLIALPSSALQCTLCARLWLVLHCMLADEPSQRPHLKDVRTMFSDLFQVSPRSLLQMMPGASRFHCSNLAMAAVRKMAADRAAAGAADGPRRRYRMTQLAAGASLERLRDSLDDSPEIDLLCDNCGLDFDAEDCDQTTAAVTQDDTPPELTQLTAEDVEARLQSKVESADALLKAVLLARSRCSSSAGDDRSTSDGMGSGNRSEASEGPPDSEDLAEDLPQLVQYEELLGGGESGEDKKDK